MSRLDDVIRERGCDELMALAWLKEKRAVVTFHSTLVQVVVPRYGPMVNGALPILHDDSVMAPSLVGAVVTWVKQYGGK